MVQETAQIDDGNLTLSTSSERAQTGDLRAARIEKQMRFCSPFINLRLNVRSLEARCERLLSSTIRQ